VPSKVFYVRALDDLQRQTSDWLFELTGRGPRVTTTWATTWGATLCGEAANSAPTTATR